MDFSRRFYGPLFPFSVLMLLVACSPFSIQQSSSTNQLMRRSTPTIVFGASHCQPPSPITPSTIGIPEVRGTASGKTELWALLFGEMVAKQEVKIVWHMTGNGDVQIAAQGPEGEPVKAKWMTFHSGSNWEHPGTEWGTGFILPKPGCWDFSVSRDGASGDVWLLVK